MPQDAICLRVHRSTAILAVCVTSFQLVRSAITAHKGFEDFRKSAFGNAKSRPATQSQAPHQTPHPVDKSRSRFYPYVNYFYSPPPDYETLIDRFILQFGNEQRAERTFRHILRTGGFKCRKCGHTKALHLENRDLHACKRCKMQHSITAGTPMHGTRTGFTAWAVALFCSAYPYYMRDSLWMAEKVGLTRRQLDHCMRLLNVQTEEAETLKRGFLRRLC